MRSTSDRSLALRLALARSFAWALLIAGWLVLGTLGRHHLPLWAGGQLAVALWLATIGGLLAGLARHEIAIGTLRLAMASAGALTAVALGLVGREGGAWALLLAAPAWGALLVGVSFGVRALRRTGVARPQAPLVPALAGTVVAWCVAGDLAAVRASADIVALGVLAAAVGIVVLMPWRGRSIAGCRSGLFDCSLSMLDVQGWRHGADWPMQAALLVMLPMMATLPVMAQWCGAEFGGTPATNTALHLAAMVLPALALRGSLQRLGRTAASTVVGLLLVAGAVTLAARPGLSGLMAASLLQSAAWSLAWAWPMLTPRAPACRAEVVAAPVATATASALPLAVNGGAVLMLGWAVDAIGPSALMAVHVVLAGLAVGGWMWARAAQRTHDAPANELSP